MSSAIAVRPGADDAAAGTAAAVPGAPGATRRSIGAVSARAYAVRSGSKYETVTGGTRTQPETRGTATVRKVLMPPTRSFALSTEAVPSVVKKRRDGRSGSFGSGRDF